MWETELPSLASEQGSNLRGSGHPSPTPLRKCLTFQTEGRQWNFWEPANFRNNERSLPLSPAQEHLARLRAPGAFAHTSLRPARGLLALERQTFPSNPQVPLFRGQAWGARIPRVEKKRPFPLVSSPDEYYSTTSNIYKSSSRQLPKMWEKVLCRQGKDMKHGLSGMVLCLLEIVHWDSGAMVFSQWNTGNQQTMAVRLTLPPQGSEGDGSDCLWVRRTRTGGAWSLAFLESTGAGPWAGQFSP